MDLLSKAFKWLGIKNGEKQPPTPATNPATPGDDVDVIDPTDYSVPPVNLNMYRASQPTNLLALMNDQIAPSATHGAELRISERFDTSKVKRPPVAPTPIVSEALDDGNRADQHLAQPLAPTIQHQPFGKYT